METKPLLYGIIGFLLGGLLVSTVATYQDKDDTQQSTGNHNQATTKELAELSGDDFDKAFIAEMIVHHQGAIDMARLIPERAKHDELKELGEDILSAQTSEIEQMRSWQKEWGYTSKSHQSH